MFRVTVKKDGKVLRTRHFSTRKRAEDYEDEQYSHNIIASMCDFEIEEVKEEQQDKSA